MEAKLDYNKASDTLNADLAIMKDGRWQHVFCPYLGGDSCESGCALMWVTERNIQLMCAPQIVIFTRVNQKEEGDDCAS